MKKKKNDWLGFSLLPAGVACTFLGIGSFSRESTIMAVALLGVGSVLLAVAWRLLKAPEAPLPESAPRPRQREEAGPVASSEAAE